LAVFFWIYREQILGTSLGGTYQTIVVRSKTRAFFIDCFLEVRAFLKELVNVDDDSIVLSDELGSVGKK
jgi:hypothetical protein